MKNLKIKDFALCLSSFYLVVSILGQLCKDRKLLHAKSHLQSVKMVQVVFTTFIELDVTFEPDH